MSVIGLQRRHSRNLEPASIQIASKDTVISYGNEAEGMCFAWNDETKTDSSLG